MKKYISTIVASVLASVFQVSAMPPPNFDWEGPLTLKQPTPIYDFISTLTPFALMFIISAQVFFIWHIVRIIIKIYVLRTIQLTFIERIFVATFSLVYLLCIIIVVAQFIFQILGYY